MATKKSPATKKNPENPIQVLREATCKSLEGSATLTYQIGIDDSGAIHFKIASNTGGGFFSNEWVSFTDIQAAFKAWGDEVPITSMTLRPLFKGRSVNTPSFLLAALSAEGLLEPMPKRKRVHRACDPAPFLANLATPRKGGRVAEKAKSNPKVKAKVVKKRTARPAQTPREGPGPGRHDLRRCRQLPGPGNRDDRRSVLFDPGRNRCGGGRR